MANYNDLIKAGLLNAGDRREAGLMGLIALGQSIGNRGAARLSPTAPPLDLAGPMAVYQNSMNTALQRGALAKKLNQETALRKAIMPQPVNEPMAQRMAQTKFEPTRQAATALYGFSPLSGEDNDMSLEAGGIPAMAQDAVTAALPAARQMTTVPKYLQGVPAAARPLVSAVSEANPMAGLQMAGNLMAEQFKYRKPQYHNVTVDGTPMRLTTPQLEQYRGQGATIAPYSSPLVSNVTNAPNAMAQVGVGIYTGAQKQATLAAQKEFQLGEMRSLLSTGVPTGRLADMSMGLKNILASFGVNNPNLPIQEAIYSLGDELALAKHGPGMGPMTDKDFEIYAGIAPGLKNTPLGNALIMQRMDREYRGQIMYAQAIQEQMTNPQIGPQRIDPAAAWRTVAQRLNAELGPLVPEYDKVEDIPDSMIGRAVMIDGNIALVGK